jgi:hypothetical protein
MGISILNLNEKCNDIYIFIYCVVEPFKQIEYSWLQKKRKIKYFLM